MLEFKDVDILFGRGSRRVAAAAVQAGVAALDAGASRAEIAARLGVTVGVAGASLSVRRGEICVLMGLSGSGKSTLLRAANALNAVTRGQVLVRDGDSVVDVARCAPATLRHLRRHRIAMVFQQFGLLPWRTVRQNVGLGLELRGEPVESARRIVQEKLDLVSLSQWADRHVSELSGGMQQRVGLARAFATDADILLMDEPFSALDPLIRTKLQDELLALQERVKKTILFVSHDLDEALRLGDRICILEGGRIVQTGTAQDIVLRPASDYVAEFVHHMNPLTVLTGEMVMRATAALARDTSAPQVGEALWLDAAQRCWVQVDAAGKPTAARIGGQSMPVQLVDTGSPPASIHGLALAPVSASLQEIIHLRDLTGAPVLLGDAGVLLGICDESEIVAALAGRTAAERAADARAQVDAAS